MALLVEPVAIEQLAEMRNTLGPLYSDAIWAQRAFEQLARNGEAMANWRASYPAWDRLFQRPVVDLHARIAQVVAMPSKRSEDSKAA
jgi:hypothetical protein